jgi:hypothetical protein
MSSTESETATPINQIETAPSADWVKAVSEYLDTDPTDLLAELGYYDRPEETRSDDSRSEPAANVA